VSKPYHFVIHLSFFHLVYTLLKSLFLFSISFQRLNSHFCEIIWNQNLWADGAWTCRLFC